MDSLVVWYVDVKSVDQLYVFPDNNATQRWLVDGDTLNADWISFRFLQDSTAVQVILGEYK